MKHTLLFSDAPSLYNFADRIKTKLPPEVDVRRLTLSCQCSDDKVSLAIKEYGAWVLEPSIK